MKDFKVLVDLCKDRAVYIQTHDFPDPDAIASAFGLQGLLAYFGVESTLCYKGKIDKLSATKMLENFDIEIFSYEELKDGMSAEDAIICVDCQKSGGNVTDFIGDEIAAIDHHPTFVEVDYQYEDITITGACATLIASYYRDLGITPDQNTATALLYGLRMDTLQFSRGVTELDIEMFGYLFPLADRELLTGMERNNLELQDLRAYGAAINNISLYGKLAIAEIPFSCPDGLIAALSDFLLSLEEVFVAVVYCYRENGIKFSVRSETEDVHAGNLARVALEGLGNGGGHREMAGGMILKEQQELMGFYPENLIKARFLEVLNINQMPKKEKAEEKE